jgi:hypothetical protein
MNESMTFFYAALREFRREVALKNLKKSRLFKAKKQKYAENSGRRGKKTD